MRVTTFRYSAVPAHVFGHLCSLFVAAVWTGIVILAQVHPDVKAMFNELWARKGVGPSTQTLFFVAVFIGCCAFATMNLSYLLRRLSVRITLTEDRIVYRDMYRRTREILYGEIRRLFVEPLPWVAYQRAAIETANSRIVVYGTLERYDEFVEMIQSQLESQRAAAAKA